MIMKTKHRVRLVAVALAATMVWPGATWAKPRKVNDYHWENVGRIIAIGDLHGDYGNYIATLQAAGLVDKDEDWIGGDAHLVQTGDIPDRGPDTLDIIEHLDKLAKQAKRKGGRVHSLIGNHEAMNVYGDTRYVHEGEFKAFETRKSAKLRDDYYALWIKNVEANNPEAFAELGENHREEWNKTHPLGWVEHRQAWDPAWNPRAKYARWVTSKPVALKVNDYVFLHGGISAEYAQTSLADMSRRASAELRKFDPSVPRLVEDVNGPLWYRGLSGVEPQATSETLDSILAFQEARGIVVGHTPTSGIIWPSYDGRVIQIDTGIAAHYGGHVAYLEITPEGLTAGYPGYEMPLPTADSDREAYLEAMIGKNPGNPHLARRLERLRAPPEPPPAAEEASVSHDSGD